MRAAEQSQKQSQGDIVKVSAMVGLAGGLASSAIYYVLSKTLLGPKEDELVTLKKNLI